jgi:hypothetical protein
LAARVLHEVRLICSWGFPGYLNTTLSWLFKIS